MNDDDRHVTLSKLCALAEETAKRRKALDKNDPTRWRVAAELAILVRAREELTQYLNIEATGRPS